MSNQERVLTACAVGGGLLGTAAGLSLVLWLATLGWRLGDPAKGLGMVFLPAVGSGLGTMTGYYGGRALLARHGAH
jgi:hypothetical protein